MRYCIDCGAPIEEEKMITEQQKVDAIADNLVGFTIHGERIDQHEAENIARIALASVKAEETRQGVR